MSDEYHLRINGNAWYGWTAMRISAGIDRLARDFEVQVTRRASEKGELLDAVSTGIQQGDRVEVLIGRDLVLTGYVDAKPVSYDARNITRSIRGRSRTGDLIDSAATVRQFRGQTPQQIAAALCQPFGVSVFGAAGQSPISDFSVDWGEAVAEAIDRMMQQQRLLAYDDANGDLHFGAVGALRATTPLVYGKNILSCSAPQDQSDCHSEYRVAGQRAGTDDDFGESSSTKVSHKVGGKVGRYRPLLIKQPGQASVASCRAMCEFEARRREAKAREATYTVRGWRQESGALWLPNMVVSVTDPHNDFAGDELVIAEVEYSRTDSGTIATLRVGPADAYLPDVPDPKPARKSKDEDIF